MSTEINAESPDGAADDTPKVIFGFFCVGGERWIMCRRIKKVFLWFLVV